MDQGLQRAREGTGVAGGNQHAAHVVLDDFRIPPTRVETLGQPKHMASRMLRQKLSVSEVTSPMSATWRYSSTSLTFSRTITRSARPSRRTWSTNGANDSPASTRS